MIGKFFTPPCGRILLRSVAVLLAVLSLSACKKEKEDSPQDDRPTQRTVLLYVVAQNSLRNNWGRNSEYSPGDSLEIAKALQSLGPDNRLIAFVDDGRQPRAYRFKRGSKPELLWSRSGELCATDPATLREVLAWTAREFPAEEYGLVMWSHADGWLPATNSTSRPASFGIDVGEGGTLYYDQTADGRDGVQMEVTDMAAAISESGVHLRYIFFDACLMQNVEVCYALRHVTDYVIASPIAVPANGAFYTNMVKKGLFNSNPAEIARTYYEDISNPELYGHYGNYGIVVSAVRTDRLEALAQLTAEVLPRSALMNRTSPEMNGVQVYQNYISNFFYRPHNYDAADAMEQLLQPEDYLRYRAALDAAVVYKAATPDFYLGPSSWSRQDVGENYCALSMFIPQTVYTTNAGRCKYGDLNEAFRQTEWYKAAGWEATGW